LERVSVLRARRPLKSRMVRGVRSIVYDNLKEGHLAEL